MNMTQREAYALAEMLIKTWPTGPKQAAWSDMLQRKCTHDPAWQTYRQLADTEERPPTLAGFLAVYRRHAGTVNDYPVGAALPPPEDVVSFTDYLTRLAARAERGDPEAVDMLAIWDDNETHGRTRGGWHPSMGREQ